MSVYALLISAVAIAAPFTASYQAAVDALREQRAAPASCVVAPSRPARMSISVAERVDTMRHQHASLRKQASGAIPASRTSVYVLMTSSHLSTTQLSFIATRDRLGSWSVSRVGRTTYSSIGGIQAEPADVEPEIVTVVPRERGAEIDRLVADPCLYAQPFMADDGSLPPVGQWETSLAVVTPRRMYAGYAFGPLPEPGGKLVFAITGW